jgi:acyl-CoA reductase-like NAD-dependent aldehyde dehydrogenase
MRYQWVGGLWLKANRERIAVINPATEDVIDHAIALANDSTYGLGGSGRQDGIAGDAAGACREWM